MKTDPFPQLTVEAFEAGEIDAGQFNHEAHVYMGWLYLGRFDTDTAIGRFTAALIRLTEKLGVPEKYHATITWFFLVLIAERRLSERGKSWAEFRAHNGDLFLPKGGILQRYYSRERITSDVARRQFLLPDLVPVDTRAA